MKVDWEMAKIKANALVALIAAQGAFVTLLLVENVVTAVFDGIGAPPLFATLSNAPFALPLSCLLAVQFALAATAFEREATTKQTALGGLVLVALLFPVLEGFAAMLGVLSGPTALVGALLCAAVLFKLVRDFWATAALGALIPAAVLALIVVAVTEDAYALRDSVRRATMDPNAVLYCAIGALGTLSAFATAISAAPGRTRLKSVLAASMTVAVAAILFANIVLVVPRLYLEAHVAIVAFCAVLLTSVGFYFLRERPPNALARGALVLIIISVVLGFAPKSKWEPRRTSYTSELVRLPWTPLLDRDADGFDAAWSGGLDCEDGDASVNPIAPEVAADGIDQNCTGSDLEAATKRSAAPTQSQADLVILISIDTLRPDHMSVYGHKNSTTPTLDAHRKEFIRFDRAYASGGITTLSLPSMLRGRIPMAIDFEPVYRTTDVRYVFPNDLGPEDRPNRAFPSPRSDSHPTIGTAFSKSNLQSFAFVDDGPASIFQRGFGFETGFTNFTYPNPPDADGTWNRESLTSAFITALPDMPTKSFVWLHYYDPHNAMPPCRQFEQLPRVGCYDDSIHDVDAELGRVFEALKETGRWSGAAVFVTSDHGEAFGEHGLSHHGLDSYEEFVRIPLLLKLPNGMRGGESNAMPVSLIDIATTATSLVGLKPESTFQGHDLSQTAEPNRPVVSQALLTTASGVPYRQQSLWVTEDHTIMVDRVSGRRWSYSLGSGTFEQPKEQMIEQFVQILSDLERRPKTETRRFP